MICELITHAELNVKNSPHIVMLEGISFHHDKKKMVLESSSIIEFIKEGDLDKFINNDANYS
jgi:hypothetical protein